MLSNEEIEKLIEDMTKVRPEMLNEEALKLFNTIMKIIDERDKLKEEVKDAKEYADEVWRKQEEMREQLENLKEIEEEHRKTNGKLRKELAYYKDILIGKSIQEMGISSLYGGANDEHK